MAQPERPQKTKWCLCIACWVTKGMHTHTALYLFPFQRNSLYQNTPPFGIIRILPFQLRCAADSLYMCRIQRSSVQMAFASLLPFPHVSFFLPCLSFLVPVVHFISECRLSRLKIVLFTANNSVSVGFGWRSIFTLLWF